MTSTTSAGSGWKRTSLGTTAPTDNEKLTLFAGATFSLAIDSLTRVRWLLLRLAETLTLDERDCAVFVWLFDGWAAVLVDGWSLALELALVPVGDACDRLFVGGAVLVCPWLDEFDGRVDWACEGTWDDGEAWFDWACERAPSLLPEALGVEWPVVVGDFDVPEGIDWAFWADGVELGEEEVDEDADGADGFEDGADEFELVWLCAVAGGLVLGCSLGDWANAQVPSIRPMAVVINKRSFMFLS
jgi:hypothetical protein